MECPFKIGDTVQLKSGGPKMTVYIPQDVLKGDEYLSAKWFDVSNILHRDSFSPETLVRIE